MLQSTEYVKVVTIILSVVALVLSVLFAIFMFEWTLRSKPIQYAQVKVLEKRMHTRAVLPNRCIVSFELPDGTMKDFAVTAKVFDTIQESETGKIVFQERKKCTKWSKRYFLRFEEGK